MKKSLATMRTTDGHTYQSQSRQLCATALQRQQLRWDICIVTLTFTPFWITTPPHVLYALQTLTCCPFLVFALPLPPVVLVLHPPLCGTRSHLAFTTLPLPIPSVTFLKLTASSRLLAPPSGSPKCLRFGLWLTLCTLNIYLLTYLYTANRWRNMSP